MFYLSICNFVSLSYFFSLILSLTTAETKCQKLLSEALAKTLFQDSVRVGIGGFVPQCYPNGSFKPKQIWGSTGYSWCVDECGFKIPGTEVPPSDGRKPNCNKIGIILIASFFFFTLTSFFKNYDHQFF